MALSTINASTGLTDGTVTSVKLADFAAAVDLNGVELILDADQDTSITADTDDRIDFKIANVEHFSFSNSSGDTVVKPMVDAKDIIFQQYDGNILLTIDDAGFVGIHNSAAGPGVIRIYEDTDLGSHYSGFTVGNLTASVSYVLPAADGSSGEQLTTNGSGVLSWATGGVSLANDANNRVVTGTGSGLNGEANLTFDGSALQLTGTLTVGVDDTGYDVKLFGATSGKSLLWDESADSLIVTGTTTLVGTTNLDAVDIDGAVQLDSTLTVGVNDTGYDVKFFGATAGKSLLWDESADTLIVTGNATISGTAVTTGVHTFTAVPVFPNNTIETADIQADAITNAKIADDQIDSEHYVDGSIDTAHIADNAITIAKASGFGKIGQVLQQEYATATALSATSYADNGQTLAITPSATSSKILVMVETQVKVHGGGADSNYGGRWKIVRTPSGGSAADAFINPDEMVRVYNAYTGASFLHTRMNITHLDSPNTTSEVTYKVMQQATAANIVITSQIDSGKSKLTLMEVLA